MFQSTRRYLTLWYATITALLLLIIASGVYSYVRATLIERIDDTLNHVVEIVERSLVIEPAGDGLVWMLDGHISQQVNVEASFRNNTLFQNDDDRIDLEWFDVQGTLQWSTFDPALPLPLNVLRHEETVTIEQPLGQRLLLRQLTERVQLGRQVLGYLRVSHPWFEVTKPTRRLVLDLAIGLVVLVLVVGAIGWFLAGLAMRPVQDSYQRLKQFTADASHELRNPIAMIQANVQARLAEFTPGDITGDIPANALENLEDGTGGLASGSSQAQWLLMERLTRRLGRLVDDLLFLTRQDSGMLPPQWMPVDVDSVLLELLEEYEVMALEKSITLTLLLPDTAEEEEFCVQGDRDQLTRLFSNLVQNALHHTPPGGSITLRLAQADPILGRTMSRNPAKHPTGRNPTGRTPTGRNKGETYLTVTVTDTGQGIAEADLPHIFHRFYRADASRLRSGSAAPPGSSTPSGEGSGLGLAIVQSIVEAHHGSIQVKSQVNVGSEFVVTLPR